MSLAGLLGALEHDAESRIAADLDAAAREAAAIRLESERRLGQRREATTRAVTARLAERRAEALALATRRVRGMVLESRERAMNRVLEHIRALARAPVADAVDRTHLLALAREALGYVDGETAILRASPDLVPPLGQSRGTGSRIRVLPDPTIPAGAILGTEDGRVSVDATLAGWLEAREPELRIVIARMLEQRDDRPM